MSNLVGAETSRALASRLRASLRTKYGMGMGTGLPESACLLLDISGSMTEDVDGGVAQYLNGGVRMGNRRIDKLNELALEFTGIPRFIFSSTCRELPSSQRSFDSDLCGTNMAGAFVHLKSKGIRHVVMITDGKPDSESAAIREASGLTIDCYYVGPDPAPHFLRLLSDATGGQYGAASLAMVKELTSTVKERLAIAAPKGSIAL